MLKAGRFCRYCKGEKVDSADLCSECHYCGGLGIDPGDAKSPTLSLQRKREVDELDREIDRALLRRTRNERESIPEH